ncbi:MAG: DUF1512 domain-containing protein [Thaumarchaeota archaeon]|nr:DUF1512 domain-containing protein [Nitrososphaerota archaeon]
MLNFVLYLPFVLFFLYGQRLQTWVILNSVSRSLGKLESLRNRSKKELVDYVVKECKPASDPGDRINQFLEYFTIMPNSLDPRGIVNKIEHVVSLQEERIATEVKALAPAASSIQSKAVENMVEVATTLNMLYKVVRHYYLIGKKTASLYVLMQLQMIMPSILQEADALIGAVDALKLSQPIGDGIGPMVAGRIMLNIPTKTIAKETVLAETTYMSRTVYVIKAEGPIGTVGHLGKAVGALVEDMGVKPNAIIMIDAALKLEGEKTGEIAEGIGAAIGGVGVERFRIEEVATKHQIPLYAIVVKQSLNEAISVMKKEIAESGDKAVAIVQRAIEDRTHEGDKVLVVGVGNTLGVAQ